MATTDNYTTGYASRAGGQKEQLSDLITNLEPTSLHLWNRLSHKSVAGIYEIWQSYDLVSAAQNAAPEGGDFAEDTFTPPTQAGNYTLKYNSGCPIWRQIVQKLTKLLETPSIYSYC